MRLDITDEVRQMAERILRDPVTAANPPGQYPLDVQGAVWAIVQLSDYTQDQVHQMIDQARGLNTAAPLPAPVLGGSPAAAPLPAPIVPAPVVPAAAEPPRAGALMPPAISPDEIVGAYELPDGSAFPITRWADPLVAADMSKPPAPETTDSMAQAQRNGEAWGREAYAAISPEELEEIDRQIEEARKKGTEYPDAVPEPTIQVAPRAE